MKAIIDRKRNGKKMVDCPRRIKLYDDDGRYLGLVGFATYGANIHIITNGEINVRMQDYSGDWYDVKPI